MLIHVCMLLCKSITYPSINVTRNMFFFVLFCFVCLFVVVFFFNQSGYEPPNHEIRHGKVEITVILECLSDLL